MFYEPPVTITASSYKQLDRVLTGSFSTIHITFTVQKYVSIGMHSNLYELQYIQRTLDHIGTIHRGSELINIYFKMLVRGHHEKKISNMFLQVLHMFYRSPGTISASSCKQVDLFQQSTVLSLFGKYCSIGMHSDLYE